MVYAVVRVRGTVNVNPKIRRTLQLLRLTRANHCVLLEENVVHKGMLQIAKDYVTWGPIDAPTLATLIEKRGMLTGDKPVTAEYLKTATTFDSIPTLAEAIVAGSYSYKDIPDIKPLFRLSPPRQGFRSIKRSFKNKGALGNRKDAIGTLISRML